MKGPQLAVERVVPEHPATERPLAALSRRLRLLPRGQALDLLPPGGCCDDGVAPYCCDRGYAGRAGDEVRDDDRAAPAGRGPCGDRATTCSRRGVTICCAEDEGCCGDAQGLYCWRQGRGGY
ncbi:MAG: hypothetical protein IT293_06695 [Deltaproteobacteria bacterium]|nr:hypothetical protein [Deltaproteobacteria bacterium]